jgi:serine/threonine protein kinase
VFESTAADAELKLIDFGLSRHFSADEVMHVPVGTPYSIAAEVLTGSYTSACDLWSLGMFHFEAVYAAVKPILHDVACCDVCLIWCFVNC